MPAVILNQLAAVCAVGRGGYVGETGRESVIEADFNGDGTRDYLIDARAVSCARSLGAGEMFDVILMTAVRSSYEPLIRARVHDIIVERSDDAAVLWLEMSGASCGRVPARQRCRNRMDWAAAQGRFGYGRTLFVDEQGGLSERPSYPPMDASLPQEFARGSFRLGRGPRGGCGRFYGDQAETLRRAYREGDANTLASVSMGLGCDTDLAWYFLGYAAELFGQNDAAYAYYDRALRRHNQFTLNLHSSCKPSSLGACWGLDLPLEAQSGMMRMQAR